MTTTVSYTHLGNELLLSDILGTDEDMIMRPLEEDVDICVLRQALRDLPDREREIVLMRFGLEGRRELTQKEVAQKMGISQSYISRLEKRIMLRLKKEFLLSLIHICCVSWPSADGWGAGSMSRWS